MELITERQAFLPGHGRNKGSINKTTRERTELFRQKLDETNVLFQLVDEIMKDIERGNIRFMDKVNALKTLAPYLVQTVNMDEIATQIAAITNPEDAKRVANEIAGQLRVVR
ncbi:hypothetical protein CH513_15450 [Salmonella enterica subsp. enterica serovar Infantis]|nr:hypothetical protein [Salmonella enterica subsp. enterica serovar Infantis]